MLDNPLVSDTITAMPSSPSVSVRVDLSVVLANTRGIAASARVPVLAVIKADAYGLGAVEVAKAIHDIVGGFVVFSLDEAVDAGLSNFPDRSILTLGPPPPDADAELFIRHRVRPAVWSAEQARVFRQARPVLSVDTGMQRFACPADQVVDALSAGQCDQAFTHAIRIEHVHRLLEHVGGRGLFLHAAATSLLDIPEARLDAVRPGLALYRSAVRVSARLVETRDSISPAGYTGFVVPRHGVILCGYSHGLRPGPCLINGTRRQILETGMQSAFVELGSTDRAGDEVVLLGDGLTESDIAADWGTSPQQVLVRMCRLGPRSHAT